MAEHTLKRFDEELERLSATISEMGGLAEAQLAQSLVALRERDTDIAERIIADDARVDALDIAVQEQTVKLLALRQPMAVDLRVILSSIKIAAALERIADYAKNTAKRSIVLSKARTLACIAHHLHRLNLPCQVATEGFGRVPVAQSMNQVGRAVRQGNPP
jgi:phosphate transport system protein